METLRVIQQVEIFLGMAHQRLLIVKGYWLLLKVSKTQFANNLNKYQF